MVKTSFSNSCQPRCQQRKSSKQVNEWESFDYECNTFYFNINSLNARQWKHSGPYAKYLLSWECRDRVKSCTGSICHSFLGCCCLVVQQMENWSKRMRWNNKLNIWLVVKYVNEREWLVCCFCNCFQYLCECLCYNRSPRFSFCDDVCIFWSVVVLVNFWISSRRMDASKSERKKG